MQQATEGLFKFEDHFDSAGYRYCAQYQDDCRYKIARREQTKAGEEQGQPEHHKRDEQLWSTVPDMLGQEPTCIADSGGKQFGLV